MSKTGICLFSKTDMLSNKTKIGIALVKQSLVINAKLE